jgi:hypothetical protein
MDLTTALSMVDSMTLERKKELLGRYSSGLLSDDEKEELKKHLLKAVDNMSDEIETVRDLIDDLRSGK